MTWKKSLVIIILNIKYNEVINKTYNTKFQNIKILIIIKK